MHLCVTITSFELDRFQPVLTVLFWFHIFILDVSWPFTYNFYMLGTVKCCCNAIRYVMILYTVLQRQRQNVNKILNFPKTLQQILHSSPMRATYGVSAVRFVVKIEHDITALHCIMNYQTALVSGQFYLLALSKLCKSFAETLYFIN